MQGGRGRSRSPRRGREQPHNSWEGGQPNPPQQEQQLELANPMTQMSPMAAMSQMGGCGCNPMAGGNCMGGCNPMAGCNPMGGCNPMAGGNPMAGSNPMAGGNPMGGGCNPMAGGMGGCNPMMMNPMMAMMGGGMNPMMMNPMMAMMMNPMMAMMNGMMGGGAGMMGGSSSATADPDEDPEQMQRRLGKQVMANTMAALRRGEMKDDVVDEDEDDVQPGPSPNVHHPNYRPANMEIIPGLTDRRYEGVIKLFVEEKGFGYIACEELRNKYPDDVFLHHLQKRHFVMGDHVSFNVFLNFKGRPQATELRRRSR